MSNVPQKLGSRLWRAHLAFQEHEGSLSAASIAYYIALSFFPLLLVLVAGLAAVLECTQTGQNAQHELMRAIAQQGSPDLAKQVGRVLSTVQDRAPSTGPIGFLVLVASAIAIFGQLDAAFDRVWRVPTDPHANWLNWVGRLFFQRLKALGMLLGVAALILAVMISSMVWSGIQQKVEEQFPAARSVRWEVVLAINLALTWAALAVLYRVVPKAQVRWREAARGALLAAVLWEVGRQALAAYVLHLNYPTAYGIIGSFIAVMLWAYYAALVILFGAEYVRVLGEERTAGSSDEKTSRPVASGRD
jgi:membrane protein